MQNETTKTRKREPLMPQALLVALALTSLLLLGADAQGWDSTRGFLGTYAPLLVDINLIAQAALLIVLIAGLVTIKRRNTPAHRTLLTAVVFFSIVLTLFVMGGRLLVIYSPGNYGALQIGHTILGAAAILSGLYLVLIMNNRLPRKYRLKKWKLLMRVSWFLFLLTALLGIVLYRMLYVL